MIILPHWETFQHFIGKSTAHILSEKIGTDVSVGKIQFSFPNGVIINDVRIKDKQDSILLNAKHLYTRMQIMPLLLDNKIIINEAGLYGINADIYRDKKDYNFQFIIDAFASNDTTHTPLYLAIEKLTLRNSNIKFRDADTDVSLCDFSTDITLDQLTDDSLKASVRSLSCSVTSKKLKLNDLKIANLKTKIERANSEFALSSFLLKLPDSEINIASAKYNSNTGRCYTDIQKSTISSKLFESYLPQLKNLQHTITLNATISGEKEQAHIHNLYVETEDHGLICKLADAEIGRSTNKANCHINLRNSTIKEILTAFTGSDNNMISHLGDIAYQGQLSQSNGGINVDGVLSSAVGNLSLSGTMIKQSIKAAIKTDGIDMKAITGNNDLGLLVADININGTIASDLKHSDITADILAPTLQYKEYTYHDILIDAAYRNSNLTGHLVSKDINCNADLTFTLADGIKADGQIVAVNPNALNLTKEYPNTVFSAILSADLKGTDPDTFTGFVTMQDITMKSQNKNLAVDALELTAENVDGKRQLTFNSDFAHADINGRFTLTSLYEDVIHAIKTRLPSVPGLPDVRSSENNRYNFAITLDNTTLLKSFINLPLELYKPLTANGSVDNSTEAIRIEVQLPSFSYDGTQYKDGQMLLSTPSDTMLCKLFVSKLHENGQHYNIHVNSQAAHNILSTSISWDNPFSSMFNGQLNTNTEFYRDRNGSAAAYVNINPSEVILNDTAWYIKESSVEWAEKKLRISDFTLKRGEQHITIDGVLSKEPEDSLTVDLHDVNVEYVLNAVEFDAVEFSGLASGKAVAKSLFSSPEAYAQITVNDFNFEHGNLGTLAADVNWNKEEEQIDITAHVEDEEKGTVEVSGYISPSRNYIDLAMKPENVNISFLQSFINGVMDSTEGRGTGELLLTGPLTTIQLLGWVSANARCHVHALNTDYELRRDTVYFVPDDILFSNVHLYDKYNNVVVVNGGVHHKHLTRLTFDLGMKTDKLLAYETHTFGDEVFYGTVFARGNVTMKGISGQVNISGDVTPLEGTTFTYNAAVQNYLNTQKFITFRDKGKVNINTFLPIPTVSNQQPEVEKELTTNLYCDFNINVTQEGQVRVLMDARSGDMITLYGDGQLKASYYNKGKFGLYGTYNVDHGNYNLSIQNIIHKDFTFNQGSTITFVGDPYDAVLNLNANYFVNNVSLSDLSIGSSFTNNTIRVNCLMDITGTAGTPVVSFDLDMPTVNADEKSMIRSLINSEEDMNQQVMYLLGIGRFYARTNNNSEQVDDNRDQTTLAMQSLLSGTISSQINTMLGHIINNKNWNVGANISTGDQGWNNAQYEGTVSGRMFNNRLIFNGQFGYRDNVQTENTTFIGDFELQYLLLPNGNLSIKAYNQSNERYFTKSSLNTQGIGLLMKKDFSSLRDLFTPTRRKK